LFDAFGWALTAGDSDGDGFDDLAAGATWSGGPPADVLIGAPDEAIGSVVGAGMLVVVHGTGVELPDVAEASARPLRSQRPSRATGSARVSTCLFGVRVT
jgi:FG-GAP repeat